MSFVDRKDDKGKTPDTRHTAITQLTGAHNAIALVLLAMKYSTLAPSICTENVQCISNHGVYVRTPS